MRRVSGLRSLDTSNVRVLVALPNTIHIVQFGLETKRESTPSRAGLGRRFRDQDRRRQRCGVLFGKKHKRERERARLDLGKTKKEIVLLFQRSSSGKKWGNKKKQKRRVGRSQRQDPRRALVGRVSAPRVSSVDMRDNSVATCDRRTELSLEVSVWRILGSFVSF